MPEQQWHLDKRVPIALILAIFVQSSGGFWWASAMNTRMEQVERRLENFASRAAENERTVTQQGREIAVLTSEIRNTNVQLERLYVQGEATNELLQNILRNRYQGGSP